MSKLCSASHTEENIQNMRHECISRKPSLIRLEIKYRVEQIFAQRMFDCCLPAQRYRSLIFMGFVHSKFGCRANAFFVHFIQSEMRYHTSSSHLQQHPQARGNRLKIRWEQRYSQVFTTFRQETLDTSILTSIVHLNVIYSL